MSIKNSGLKVVHSISGLGEKSGGPARSVPALANAVARQGVVVGLAYVQGPDDVQLNCNAAKSIPCSPSRPFALRASSELAQALESGEFDVYHAHGMWELTIAYTARAARRRQKPYLIAPRGMLEPWALRRSRLKKLIVGALYQKRAVCHGDCLHAITPCEVDSFRQYGLTNPVAVVPNGVDLAQFEGLRNAKGRLADLVPAARNRQIALFLSRLHPKKGLLHLMDAWAVLMGDHPDWLLLVCGPDDVNHRAEVESIVKALGIEHSVCFPGPLYGEDKVAALAGAECFVLPSFSEGFSMAVLEALACRLPVLITPGCNFPEVEKAGAGVIVAADAKGTEEGLRRLMSLSESERAAMGAKGRKLIEERYTWDRVGAQMVEVYEWLLKGGRPPDCVVF